MGSKTREIRPKADRNKGRREALHISQLSRSNLVNTFNVCHAYPSPFSLRIGTPHPAMLVPHGLELLSHFDWQFRGLVITKSRAGIALAFCAEITGKLTEGLTNFSLKDVIFH